MEINITREEKGTKPKLQTPAEAKEKLETFAEDKNEIEIIQEIIK